MKRDAYITRLSLAAVLLGGKGYASGAELQAALVAWRGMELFPVAYARLAEVAEPAPPEPYAPSPPAWEPGGGKSVTEAAK